MADRIHFHQVRRVPYDSAIPMPDYNLDPSSGPYVRLHFHIIQCLRDSFGTELATVVELDEWRLFSFSSISSPEFCDWVSTPLINAGMHEWTISRILHEIRFEVDDLITENELPSHPPITTIDLDVRWHGLEPSVMVMELDQADARPNEQSIQETYNHHPQVVPATKESIQNLSKVRIEVDCHSARSSELMIPCAICLNEFLQGQEATLMPCFHLYHQECIEKWLIRNNTCPVCRFEMPKY